MNFFPVSALPKLAASVRGLAPRCANPECNSLSLLHGFIARSRPGARVGEAWFCGADCFEAGASAELSRLLSGAVHKSSPRRRTRMPLGLILLSRGQISDEQLRSAVGDQPGSGKKIGDIIVEQGFATEEQVTSAVASQWGAPVFSLKKRLFEVQVRVPYRLLDAYSMVPVHYNEKTNKLLVGFRHGIEHQALNAVEGVVGCGTTPCFITPTDFRQCMQTVPHEQDEVIFDHPSSVTEISKLIRNYMIQVGGEELRIGLCRDYIWARLLGSRREMDLLFGLPMSA